MTQCLLVKVVLWLMCLQHPHVWTIVIVLPFVLFFYAHPENHYVYGH